ncbi:DUF2922 domain-containing protein [Clostridium ihumii]|uniref:DUF2922 domain-containing protein n=1 Tax=Clostridium ihumii TaxID=1470356 RepID=UPI00058D7982|nr:DUF2922 domain-containing protein [Clostridium ihumii]
MAKQLVLTFINQGGTKSRITIKNVKDNLVEDDILKFMNLVVDKNVFETSKGELVKVDSAELVETSKTKYELN